MLEQPEGCENQPCEVNVSAKPNLLLKNKATQNLLINRKSLKSGLFLIFYIFYLKQGLMYPRLASNLLNRLAFLSTYFHFPKAMITGVHHHIWICVLDMEHSFTCASQGLYQLGYSLRPRLGHERLIFVVELSVILNPSLSLSLKVGPCPLKKVSISIEASDVNL